MEPWRRNLYFSWLSQLLCILGFSAAFPFIPYYLEEIGIVDPDQVTLWTGYITTGGSLSMAIFAPIWGSLADRYGRKIMVERAAFIGAIIIFLMAFAQNAPQLLALRTIQGAFTGTVAAFTTLVACSTPRKYIGFTLGLMQMAVFSGSSGGPLLGGFVADAFGYRTAFVVCAVMLLIGGIIAWRLVDEIFVPSERRRASLMDGVRSLLSQRAILIMTTVIFSLQFTGSMVRPMMPIYMQQLQTDPSYLATMAGLIQGGTALSSAIAAALIGRLSDRIGHRLVLILCSLGAAAAYLPQSLVATSAQLLALNVLLGFFLGGLLPSANAVIALAVSDGRQGATYGITASAGAAGRAFGPVLGSAVAISQSIRALFPTAAVLYTLIAIWVAVALPGRKRLGTERTRPED